jgi:hypothetical protein
MTFKLMMWYTIKKVFPRNIILDITSFWIWAYMQELWANKKLRYL